MAMTKVASRKNDRFMIPLMPPFLVGARYAVPLPARHALIRASISKRLRRGMIQQLAPGREEWGSGARNWKTSKKRRQKEDRRRIKNPPGPNLVGLNAPAVWGTRKQVHLAAALACHRIDRNDWLQAGCW